jgi:hypothetical protein
MPQEIAATWSLKHLVDLGHRAGFHPLQAVVERNPATGDRGRARAAIGLDDVAVDGDLLFAERFEIDDGAQGAADQALDFLGAAALLSGSGFALHAVACGARQHAVFGGDPALAAVAQPRRRLFFQARGAQHMGVAELDEAGTFGMFGEIALERDLAHLVQLSA